MERWISSIQVQTACQLGEAGYYGTVRDYIIEYTEIKRYFFTIIFYIISTFT